MLTRKRLFFDIETSPNVVLSWRTGYNLTITPYDILQERAIICICWKWEGEEQVHALTWDKKQNDKSMLKAFIKEVNKADEIIGHNSDRFDIKWLRTRCVYHSVGMFPTYQTLDTLKMAKSGFNFNSNKLDYIAQYLGVCKKLVASTDSDYASNTPIEIDTNLSPDSVWEVDANGAITQALVGTYKDIIGNAGQISNSVATNVHTIIVGLGSTSTKALVRINAQSAVA